MFKTTLTALLLLSIPAFAGTAYSAVNTAYSFVIEDLPLMNGMTELPEDAVTFDQPGGRILETTAVTAENPAAVRGFYAGALPSLGWQPQGATAFVRNNEKLQLDIDSKGGKTAAHFTITPLTQGK